MKRFNVQSTTYLAILKRKKLLPKLFENPEFKKRSIGRPNSFLGTELSSKLLACKNTKKINERKVYNIKILKAIDPTLNINTSR